MTTLYCAVCRSRFEPDDTHGWVTVERRTVDDRNEVEEFALCEEHRMEITDEWGEPA